MTKAVCVLHDTSGYSRLPQVTLGYVARVCTSRYFGLLSATPGCSWAVLATAVRIPHDTFGFYRLL